MIILSKVLKESNQIKILAIRVAAKRTLDNALLLIRESTTDTICFCKTCSSFEYGTVILVVRSHQRQRATNPIVLLDEDALNAESSIFYRL